MIWSLKQLDFSRLLSQHMSSERYTSGQSDSISKWGYLKFQTSKRPTCIFKTYLHVYCVASTQKYSLASTSSTAWVSCSLYPLPTLIVTHNITYCNLRWCAGNSPLQRIKSPVCKYSHQSWFVATKVISWHTELRKLNMIGSHLLLVAGSSTYICMSSFPPVDLYEFIIQWVSALFSPK